MKLIFVLFFLFVTTSLYSQIGINLDDPQSLFHIDSQGNTVGITNVLDDVGISDIGNVGLGTIDPSTKLDIRSSVSGAIRIVDGMPSVDRVLSSDADGVGTWQLPKGSLVNGEVFVERFQVDTTWLPTKSCIDIPPRVSCVVSCMSHFCMLVAGINKQVEVSLGLSTSASAFINAKPKLLPTDEDECILSKQYTLDNNCIICNGFIADIKNDSDSTITLYLWAKTSETDGSIYYSPNNTVNDIKLYAILY